eukprot:TRINITY_DN11189_c0_g1_i1.p1 TRINITY_DN11189_c0_g1~~TRINITY_DN11189_c0_g1_i1.p1  ORF type:complete len:334 (+),score=40.36 TRINITY_DN11189_c0_g1_i1:27-1004(+)
MTASHCFSWGLALVSITAYSFNSQVFVWIGSADFGGKLFELFLFHVPASLFLLYFVCRRQDAREALEERGQSSLLYFALQVLIGACFQMGIYYLWFRASLLIPTQLLAAVFQTSIVLVYVLSVVFLGERFSCLKVAWISLAVAGVILATFGSEWFGKSGKKTSFPTGAPLLQGVLLALGAEVCKALYQVWFKRSFGEPSTRFALLFGGLVGLAHVFPVLPGVALLNAAHVHDARMTISDWSAGQGCMHCRCCQCRVTGSHRTSEPGVLVINSAARSANQRVVRLLHPRDSARYLQLRRIPPHHRSLPVVVDWQYEECLRRWDLGR